MFIQIVLIYIQHILKLFIFKQSSNLNMFTFRFFQISKQKLKSKIEKMFNLTKLQVRKNIACGFSV
jgi:hypothetical protein